MGAAGTGLLAGARQAAGRGPRGLPRQPGRDRPARRVLPAPRRVALLRPQRGVRPALRVPRLEVRRRRQLRRHAERAEEPASRTRSRVTAYPTVRAGRRDLGLHGPGASSSRRCRSSSGPRCRPTHRARLARSSQECNWLQALEGGIDTSHAPILHRAADDQLHAPGIKPASPFVRGKAPTSEVDVTDYGYRYAGVRPLDDDERARPRLPLHHAVHQIRPGRRRRRRLARRSPGTSGCRWTTTTAWSGTGSTAPPTRADRGGPPRAPHRQRPASTSTRRRSASRHNRRTTT